MQPGAEKLTLWRHWIHLTVSCDVREPFSLHQAVFTVRKVSPRVYVHNFSDATEVCAPSIIYEICEI